MAAKKPGKTVTQAEDPRELAEVLKSRSERRARGSKDVDFHYFIAGAQSTFHSEKITLSWKDICAFTYPPVVGGKKFKNILKCEKPKPKQILINVNGVANPGEFLAIMGPSGAGKTTLLNILTYHLTSDIVISGKIYANDEPIYLPTFPNIMAYVHQDDIFIGNLTVREQLMFRANVSMDKSLSSEDKAMLVDEVILELGLTACQHTVIGIPGRVKGISGGEKKRVALAGEFLNNPSLIFCDEPTSGLDSYMAATIVQVLKRLTRKGKTVICTIHQPSSEVYAEFDQILLMAQGRVAFLGPTATAMKFFSNLVGPCPTHFNPADFYILNLAVDPSRSEECKESVNMICDRYADTIIKPAKSINEVQSPNVRKFERSHNPSGVSVCLGVLTRAWLSFIRNPHLIRVKILQTTIIALIIGSVYYKIEVKDRRSVSNLNSAILIVTLNLTFQCMLSVINVFSEEIPVFLRERKKRLYGINHYFFSRIFVELPLYIINPFLFTVITYKLSDLNPDPERFFLACVVQVLAANVASGFGYMISAICNDINLALAVGPPILTPFILFGGYFVNINSIPSYYRWLTYISWFRHAMEALMVLQWEDYVAENWVDRSTSTGTFNSSYAVVRGRPYPIGKETLANAGFSADNFDDCILGLIVLNVMYRVFAYIALLIRSHGD